MCVTAVWQGRLRSKEFPRSSAQHHVILRLMVLCVSTDSLFYQCSGPTLITRGILFSCTCPVHRWWLMFVTLDTDPWWYKVGAADCRSAGPWFNSGWKSRFTFLTGYDKLTNQIIQMFNNMSPIRTVITTITRKSVNKKKKKKKKKKKEERRKKKEERRKKKEGKKRRRKKEKRRRKKETKKEKEERRKKRRKKEGKREGKKEGKREREREEGKREREREE